MNTIEEDCPCCNGLGICEDIDMNKSACLTCDGKGCFAFEKPDMEEE